MIRATIYSRFSTDRQSETSVTDQERVCTESGARSSAKLLSMLPKAAELYRREMERALAGDARSALRMRVFLRDWFTGKIRLEPLPDGGLMAH